MKFGDYRVEVISDCEFRLDGGAMFGVVPRNLWSKACPPDEQNRIRMNMNCLFIEGHGERILIDTGIGDKWPDKHRTMYGIDQRRLPGSGRSGNSNDQRPAGKRKDLLHQFRTISRAIFDL